MNDVRPQCYCLSILLLVLLSACGGLAGEPPIVATMPPQPTVVETYPVGTTDLVVGAQIFAQNCTRCHGQDGHGRGELVLSGQIANPPADFADPATARDQSPQQWFATITNGRLDKLMPPWKNSLSAADRWAVALYTYTLSYQPDQITSGQAVWTANCAECHGPTGAGDGPRASELGVTQSDLGQSETLIAQSDSGLFEVITQGKGDAMPAFNDTLDETQRWQVIAYMRTLSLASVDSIGQTLLPPAATAEVEAASAPSVPGVINGRVTNGTQNGTIDSGVTVTLYIVDNQFNQQTQQTTTAADGTFAFSDVPIQNDRAYIVTTSYQDSTFSSSMVNGDTTTPVLDLPITVYDATDDPSVITISDFVAQISGSAGSLQVTQIMNFHNISDRLYSQNNAVAGAPVASVTISLPPGASLESTANDAQRYVLSQDGSFLIDTMPVYPNEDHIVHFTYTVPFTGSAQVELPLNYAFDGSVQMLLEPASFSINSAQLNPLPSQTMGGTVFQIYGANLSLPAGNTLRYSVIESSAVGGAASAFASNNLLAYIFIGLGSLAILAAVALYVYERRFATSPANNQELTDMLLEQIAGLDDMNQKGQIDPVAYQQQRQRLKKRLSKLMNNK